MKKQEFKSLELTDNEISAVRRYISNAHISMNALLDIDPDVILKQKSKGWVIDLSKDGIAKNMDYLEELYSAIYKYSLQNNRQKTVVYRGTSIDEINKLTKEGISGRFLSTAADKNVAMRFTEYQKGALVTLALEDVPHIMMDDFLDETQVSEREILISPFSMLEEITAYSVQDIDGVKEYNANVKKKEFKNITEEEREKCKNSIYSFDYDQSLEKYRELDSRLEIITEKISRLKGTLTKEGQEELQYLTNQRLEVENELVELKDKFNEVKTAMNLLLQDKFKSVELEVEKNLEQDKIEYEEEEKKRKIASEKSRIKELLNNADETLARIRAIKQSYMSKDEEEEKFYEQAKKLGLTINMLNPDDSVNDKFTDLSNNICDIKSQILDIEIPDNITPEELGVKGEINQNINTIYEKLSIVNKVLFECEKTVTQQKNMSKATLSRKLAEKIGEDITTKAKEEISLLEESLLNSKESLLDRLTGKAKIKKAQIQNLRLKRQFIENGGLNLPTNMGEMTEYITKYASVVGKGKLPDSIKCIVDKQNMDSDAVITDEERESFEMTKAGSILMPTIKSKKQQLKLIENNTEELKKKIAKTHKDSDRRLIDNLDVGVKNSIEMCLDTAIFYTKEHTEEEKRQMLSKQITL